jgi:hypothetical protein
MSTIYYVKNTIKQLLLLYCFFCTIKERRKKKEERRKKKEERRKKKEERN